MGWKIVPMAAVIAVVAALGFNGRGDAPPRTPVLPSQVAASRCAVQLDDAGPAAWPVWVDPPGQPASAVAAVEAVTAPGRGGAALRIGLLSGADAYTGAHAYYTHQLPAGAQAFALSFDYLLPPTSLNNREHPSIAQAFEISLSLWKKSDKAGVFYRYEWGLQYQIVGNTAPDWRLWNGTDWVTTGIQQELVGGDDRWHTVLIEGYVGADRDGNGHGDDLRYVAMRSDDLAIPLGIDLPLQEVQVDASQDYATVAVQLDGNFQQDPYAVTIDNVVLCPYATSPWGD